MVERLCAELDSAFEEQLESRNVRSAKDRGQFATSLSAAKVSGGTEVAFQVEWRLTFPVSDAAYIRLPRHRQVANESRELDVLSYAVSGGRRDHRDPAPSKGSRQCEMDR